VWKGLDKRAKLKLLLSYSGDWIITILLAGLFYLLDYAKGFRREFSLTDTSIQYTFATKERVPDHALYLIALVAPLVIMPIVNLITIRSWWDWHNSWLGCILGLALTGSITNIVKVTVGRPRPDLIDRCQPTPGSQNAPVYGLVTSAICTQTDESILKDGFKSFFSGHSSLSFAGLGFLAFYLAGKLHLFDRMGHSGKSWIAFAPLTGAALVAISRTMDYRHHWHDVLVGSIVGLVLAWFSYRQYYPPLTSTLSHRPYSPRSIRAQPKHKAGRSGAGPHSGADADLENGERHEHSHRHTTEDDYAGANEMDLRPELAGTVPRSRGSERD
jgi:diacylglycerol diphosphate phosphatase/phosphatidate phosphatase